MQRCTETRRRASAPDVSEGRPKYRSLAPKRGPSGVSAGVQANCEDFVRARPVKRELGLEDLGFRVRLRALADGGRRVVHPYLATNGEFGDRAQRVGEW